MAGFSFNIGDEQLFLGEKTKISISIENYLLSTKTIPGAISFPFNIPNVAHNRKLLNISDTLITFEEKQNTKCRCNIGGNFWKAGFITINNVVSDSINISYTEFNSEEDFSAKSLQELDFPIIDTSDIFYDKQTGYKSSFHIEIINRANRIWLFEKDYVCPTVYNSKTHDVVSSFGFQNLYSNDNYANGWYDEIIGNAISPFLFVNYILKNLFNSFGLKINNNKLKEQDLDDLIVYINRCNLMTQVPSLNPSDNFDCYFDEPNIRLAEYLPNVSLTTFLSALQKTFNLLFSINWINGKVDILCKNDLIKVMKCIDISNISEKSINLDFKNDYKEITSINYAKKDDLIITEDNTRFTLKGYQYKGTINSLAEIPAGKYETFDYFVLRLLNNTYTDAHSVYFYDVNGNWSLSLRPKLKINRPYDVYFKNVKSQENKLELGIDSTILRINKTQTGTYNVDTETIVIVDADFYQFYCPAVDIGIAANTNHYPGNSGIGGKTDIATNESIRLLFYRGMRKEMKDGGDFPFANRNEFDISVINPGVPNDENTNNPSLLFSDTFNHSLEIDGPKGIWQMFYKDWQEFLSKLSRLVTYNIRFSPAQIINGEIFLNFLQDKGKRFIISKITITGDANKIYPCKTEMYQIEPK